MRQSDKVTNKNLALLFHNKFRLNQHISFTFLILLCAIGFCTTGCANLFSPQTTTPNQSAVQQLPKARLTYVAIGASDTYGIGADAPVTQSWPAVLTTKLGSGVRLVNLGIPNIDASSALNVEVPVAIDSKPNVITIWLAVNDLADNVPVNNYAQTMNTILTRLQTALPNSRIAIANVPDVTLLPHFQDQNQQELRTRISAYNTAIADLVQKHHVLLVDLYTRWQDLANHPEYISDDGFHPSVFGYAAIATIFYQVLQENAK